MHIGLYFGSFNPIHTGHLIVANHIIEHTEINKIWFVVSPHNPLKDSHSLLNEHDRLHLVNLAIEDNPKFRASNVEFNLPKPSYTIDTLTYLIIETADRSRGTFRTLINFRLSRIPPD